jgi:hypothetical protein
MSVIINPPISVGYLAELPPGLLIQVGNLRGLTCSTPSRSGAVNVVSVLYDPTRGAFQYQPTIDLPILVLGQELIITPELDSLDQRLSPLTATTELFIDGSTAKIVFKVDERGGSGMRCLNLQSSAIEGTLPSGVATAFKIWSISVAIASGEYLPLMTISSRMGAMFDNQGPLEPDEV